MLGLTLSGKRFICLFLLCMFVSLAQADDFEMVYFPGKSYPISALKKRIAQQKNLKAVEQPGDPLSGQLYKPSKGESFPAIVMVHDCRGIQPYQQQWAEQLMAWGYVVLMLDSFTTRQIKSTCEGLAEKENYLIRGGRTQDIFAAYDYLKQQDYVSPFRIGLMGWDYHSVLGALANHGLQQKFAAPFMGAVAIYPSCNATIGTGSVSPLLIFAAQDDDWTPAEQCHLMMEYSKGEMDKIKVEYLADAKHGFDDPALSKETYFPTIRNYFKNPAVGVTMQYNLAAHQQTIKLARQFLDFNVKYRPIQITLDDLPAEFSQAQINKASWVNPRDQVGEDIPAQGYSLFDRVFSVKDNGVYRHDIPYPFDRLLDKLSKLTDQPDAKKSNLKFALFPNGRSLTRNSSAPEFFKYPRIIVTVDAEAKIKDGQYGPLLKDRLYIALTEKDNVLEVISYNDIAQRFEFQIVHDYGENKTPSVIYAQRSLCLSCHQNHAPIFPNAPWDETNFNEKIFSEIKAVRNDFYGFTTAVPALSSTNDIDRSTNRATRLPIYHALWQKSCMTSAESERTSQCRAQLLKSMLQYQLSNRTGFDGQSTSFEARFISVVTDAWRKHWPNGLAIPSANITDRNPFVEKMVVSSKFDPLRIRDPETIWFGENLRDVKQVIAGLSQQIHSHDINNLDKYLMQNARDSGYTRFASDCMLTPTRATLQHISAKIHCIDRQRAEKNNFELIGKIGINRIKNIVSGRFNSIKLANGSLLYDVKFGPVKLGSSTKWLVSDFEVHHKKSKLSVRAVDGNAVVNFQLKIDANQLKMKDENINAELTFSLANDFLLVSNAIDVMLRDKTNAYDALFDADPFNSYLVMKELFSVLDADESMLMGACCQTHPDGLEKKALGIGEFLNDQDIDLEESPINSVFLTLCGACHRTGLSLPPSFMSGDQEQIKRNLTRCAPRIAYRLQMWRTAIAERPKSPMPPVPPKVNGYQFNQLNWVSNPVIERLTQYAISLIDSPLSPQNRLAEILKTPFQNLDECRFN